MLTHRHHQLIALASVSFGRHGFSAGSASQVAAAISELSIITAQRSDPCLSYNYI
jgi:hypothetical protein